VDRAFGGARPVFGPLIYYLPGNHDHHVWEGAREGSYLNALRGLGPQDRIPPPRHTTPLIPAQLAPYEGDLLSALIHRRPGCAGVEVRIAYPNLALTADNGSQALIVSHGHFTESIYTLMSRMREILFPNQPDLTETTDVETLEAENFAWIDFFWSTLGRSGAVGIDVSRIYADLQSPGNLDVLATNLAHAFTSRPQNPKWLRGVESTALGAILRREVRNSARAERGMSSAALSPKGRAGLCSYLEGVVASQVKDQLGSSPSRSRFVFGHTHKPFLEGWDVKGFTGPMTIANTGGWVVDTATAAPCQGGAMVVVDDDLNSAVLVAYQQDTDGVAPARVLPEPPEIAGTNPLPAYISERLAADDQPWKAVGGAAQFEVGYRWRLQANLSRTVPVAHRA
jgi:hypothetical protein